MIFADLVLGDSVFLDANTLIYHFTTNPLFGTACSDVLRRIERQEIVGFTSTHMLSDVLDLRGRGQVSHFVCADQRLCAIAAAEGLTVVNPEVP